MINTLLHLLRLLPFLYGGHHKLALENVALHQQLTVYKRTAVRPKLRKSDRLVWVWLSGVWTGWRDTPVLVAPDTVLRWGRRRFREALGHALRATHPWPPSPVTATTFLRRPSALSYRAPGA